MCFIVYPQKYQKLHKQNSELFKKTKHGLKDKRLFKMMSFHNYNSLKWNEIAYGTWWDGTSVKISDYPLIVEFVGD